MNQIKIKMYKQMKNSKKVNKNNKINKTQMMNSKDRCFKNEENN